MVCAGAPTPPLPAACLAKPPLPPLISSLPTLGGIKRADDTQYFKHRSSAPGPRPRRLVEMCELVACRGGTCLARCAPTGRCHIADGRLTRGGGFACHWLVTLACGTLPADFRRWLHHDGGGPRRKRCYAAHGTPSVLSQMPATHSVSPPGGPTGAVDRSNLTSTSARSHRRQPTGWS